MSRELRSLLGLLGAVTLIGVLLVLPAPQRSTAGPAGFGPTSSDPATARAPSVAAAPGPTLAQVWPRVHTFDFPALLPDGSAFNPIAIVDPDVAVGTVTDSGNTRALVTVTVAGIVRTLQQYTVDSGASVDAVAATPTAFFWMQTLYDVDGHGHSSLWRVSRAGGAAWQVTGDVGDAQFMNSGYDLQVVGDRVYWVAASDGDRTVLRSVRVSGGRVSARRLPGEYVLTAWPWLASSPGSTGTPVELYNVDTAVHWVVHAPANGYLTCAPVWCRMVVESRQDDTGIDIIRPDGTGRVRVGDADATAVTEDVALRGRFEVLAIGTPTSSPAIVIEQVRIFDLTRRRSVLVAPAASDAGARGDYVWWSTGDNETLAWHAVDLRSLT